jgi:ABC-type transport system involved in cytochrome bd biosynthesis fused ATPase/permease subunit
MSFGAQYVIFFICLVAFVGALYAATNVLLWWAGRARAEADGPQAARAQSAPQRAQVHAPTVHAAHDARPAPDYGAWMHAQGAPALDWLREFNDQPHIAPHVAVVGPSGSGKSTLVLAALSRRPGQAPTSHRATPPSARHGAPCTWR